MSTLYLQEAWSQVVPGFFQQLTDVGINSLGQRLCRSSGIYLLIIDGCCSHHVFTQLYSRPEKKEWEISPFIMVEKFPSNLLAKSP